LENALFDTRIIGNVDNPFMWIHERPSKIETAYFNKRRCLEHLTAHRNDSISIDVNKIIKIGGDVILVDLRRSDSCLPKPNNGHHSPPRPVPPPCPPPCPPRPTPQPEPRRYGEETMDLSGLYDSNGRIDVEDY